MKYIDAFFEEAATVVIFLAVLALVVFVAVAKWAVIVAVLVKILSLG